MKKEKEEKKYYMQGPNRCQLREELTFLEQNPYLGSGSIYSTSYNYLVTFPLKKTLGGIVH